MNDLILPDLNVPEEYGFVDEDTLYIAEYLFNAVNELFYNRLGYNIIKTYRTFNDIFIPTVDFPVLKVYKVSEKDDLDISPQVLTTFKVVYALAYTQKQKIADVSTIVAKELRKYIKNAHLNCLFAVDWSSGLSIEYEDFITPENLVYKYATLTFSVYTNT